MIVSHFRWTTESWLHAHPTISIGAHAANQLSSEILEARKAQGKDKFEEGPGGWGAFTPAASATPATDKSPAIPAIGPRVALWGQKAAETRNAVENYIRRELGLHHFLKDHAGWKMA